MITERGKSVKTTSEEEEVVLMVCSQSQVHSYWLRKNNLQLLDVLSLSP